VRFDQLIGSHRMRLLAAIEAAPSIRAGCRQVGIHHSTYYDWMNRLTEEGVEGLMPRWGRTHRRSPARIRLEAEIVALALANPPWGPERLFDELHQRGVHPGSASQVWRILKAHQLNTRRLRYRLLAVTRGLSNAELTPSPPRRSKPWIGSLQSEKPGDLVQFDCFHLGRLKESRLGVAKTPGVVWQYTAIDVASSFTWAQLHTSVHNPSGIHTTALAYQVASDLAQWGWHWAATTTDRGNEFIDHRFGQALTELGVEHRFIHPGRPQTNGKVEQVQNTILQECWKPTFVTYKEPSITGLRLDLTEFLTYYNHHRPHRGKWNKGRTPATIIIPNTGNTP
jgi:transposase